jgi:hypothetical protein
VELKDLRAADLFATPPSVWWERWLCKIIGAKTFHWGMFIAEDDGSWVITESIEKGVALTRFFYPRAYVYRIRGVDCVSWKRLVSLVADYGDYPYDWLVPLRTGVWWLLKHYFNKVVPVLHDKEVNCQEWVALLACELGVKIIPDNAYPMCTNLESSPYLEYVGELGV